MGGEAKRRGTFEQRLAQALERKKKEQSIREQLATAVSNGHENDKVRAATLNHRRMSPMLVASLTALSLGLPRKQF